MAQAAAISSGIGTRPLRGKRFAQTASVATSKGHGCTAMSDKNEADFDEAAWLSRLEKTHTHDDFVALLGELPSEPPVTDDAVIEHFQTEMAAFEARQAAEGWPTDKDEAELRDMRASESGRPR